MTNVIKFPIQHDTDIKEVVGVVWPNKVEIIKRRSEELVSRKDKWLDANRDSGLYSAWQIAEVEARIGGILEVLYIIEQEGK